MRPNRPAPVPRRAHACAAMATCLVLAVQCAAAERYFVGPTGGSWSDPANWSETDGGPGGASGPGNGDNAFGTPHSTVVATKAIRFDKIYLAGTALNDLVVSDDGIGTVRVNHDPIPSPIPELVIMPVLRAKDLVVGAGGSGTYSQ